MKALLIRWGAFALIVTFWVWAALVVRAALWVIR